MPGDLCRGPVVARVHDLDALTERVRARRLVGGERGDQGTVERRLRARVRGSNQLPTEVDRREQRRGQCQNCDGPPRQWCPGDHERHGEDPREAGDVHADGTWMGQEGHQHDQVHECADPDSRLTAEHRDAHSAAQRRQHGDGVERHRPEAGEEHAGDCEAPRDEQHNRDVVAHRCPLHQQPRHHRHREEQPSKRAGQAGEHRERAGRPSPRPRRLLLHDREAPEPGREADTEGDPSVDEGSPYP